MEPDIPPEKGQEEESQAEGAGPWRQDDAGSEPFRHEAWRHGPWGHGGSSWGRRPRRLFFAFLFTFGFFGLLFAALVALLVFIFSLGQPGPPPAPWFPRGQFCIVALLFLLFVFAGTRFLFRGIAAPLGEVMEAADAVAEGDLSARVRVSGGGSFRQLSRSFNRMAAELERADEQRRRLTADVAHELRNPLHIIRGNLEGILDGVYPADPEHIANTLDETRLLQRLVDDLQTLSLAEAGRLDLVFEPVDLSDLISDVRTSFSGQAESLGVRLEAEIRESAAERSIPGDHERLQQVFGNLVANALRHTEAGGSVRIAVFLESSGSAGASSGEGTAPDQAVIVVEDTGAGIPAEHLPYIFDRFWKGDRARTRTQGSGSGLGLAIAKQLILAHGGTIEAASEPGVGASFTIRLPAEHDG